MSLTPELLVTDVAASLRFWCGFCGFRIAYDRPEEGFALIERGTARVMLEELNRGGRSWITAELTPPFGRGINLEIEVEDLAPILAALAAAAWPLFMAPEEKWYRTGARETGVRQFLVQDPDGYLLRLQQRLGTRGQAASGPMAPIGTTDVRGRTEHA
jgi:catechol 2,3-dioxygenase-like lactoylglutathione lyase family enzyme